MEQASPSSDVAPILELSGIGKTFGKARALSDIDVAFRPGEVHCLLGENGAGKSTLCNLIFGIHRPSEGEMTLSGMPYRPAGPRDAMAASIAMVHQHFSLVNEMTVLDNLLLGKRLGFLDRKQEGERLERLAGDFGLTIDCNALVGDLSVGQRQRIEVVKCLMQTPSILILDEPTAVLLPEEIEALLRLCRRIADLGCAVVLVTHKLAEISAIADRVTVLRRGSVVAHSQTPAADIKRLVSAMIAREEVSGGSLFGVSALSPRKCAAGARSRREILQIDGLSLTDEIGAKRLDRLTLTIAEGEIVGIAGVEGNGQSELGNVLAGLATPTEGRWFIEDRELTYRGAKAITEAGVGIVPEDRHRVGAVNDLMLYENLFLNRQRRFSRFGLINRGRQISEASEMMDRFDIRAAGPQTRFGSLSGGNQQKAVLARELTTPNLKFLLAAHPTRGLDIGAVEAVYGLIRDAADQGTAVMLISSELEELLLVCDRVVVFYRGRIVGECAASPESRDYVGRLMSGQLQ